MKIRSLLFAALLLVGLPIASSSAFVAVSVGIAPPPLPVYVQPACPVAGYLWTPGYWAWSPEVGYYWVPGVWVPPPRIGVYWTPPYWGFAGGSYAFHSGYWGPSVGFYGGINYGFGYNGFGYVGGEWAGNAFRYNTAVTRVNTTVIHNTYVNKTVIKNPKAGRASFNGPGGVNRQPTEKERQAMRAEHIDPTPQQRQVHEAAMKNPDLQARKTGGKPKIAALRTPDEATRLAAGSNGAENGGPKARGNAANAETAGGNKPEDANAGGAKRGQKAENAQANAKAGGEGAERADHETRKALKADADDAGNAAAAKASKQDRAVRRNAATSMPARAHTPNLPNAAVNHGRAADAIANRGPQHRNAAPATRRAPQSVAPAGPRPAPQAESQTAPNKKKRGKQQPNGY